MQNSNTMLPEVQENGEVFNTFHRRYFARKFEKFNEKYYCCLQAVGKVSNCVLKIDLVLLSGALQNTLITPR